VSIIKTEQRKADLLAARYYKLAEGDRERAARDWYNQVKKVANMLNIPPIREEKGPYL
jgi:hypothetical protein